MFRIAVFATLFFLSLKQIADVVWLSQLPRELMIPLAGYKNIVSFIPVDKTCAYFAKIFFLLFCFLSMIGLFTRLSILITILLSLYVLGIPQFFGKVYHYHHLIWFSTILLFSQCSDRLSVDFYLKLSKLKEKGTTNLVSITYALPIRFVWLLLGIIYFFPGFWKLCDCGCDWFLTDNVKNHLYQSWTRIESFTPIFRIDNYPFLYKSFGLITILFEISFIFLILSPKLRKFAIVGGILFHLSTYVFMGVSFWYLLACYTSFIDFPKSFVAKLQSKNVNNLNQLVIVVGSLLLIFNTICGIHKIESWPFSNYPTFSFIQSPIKDSILITTINRNGSEKEVDVRQIIKKFDSARWDMLLRRLAKINDKEKIQSLCKAIWELIVLETKNMPSINSIRFYKIKISIVPEEKYKNPIKKTLLYELFPY